MEPAFLYARIEKAATPMRAGMIQNKPLIGPANQRDFFAKEDFYVSEYGGF
ncbi:hypothetical protein [Eubacterium ramulus]